jgi:pimeloyl-ACP methyl ester carboxylesterase
VGVAPSEFELPDLAGAIEQSTLIIHDRDDRELPFTLSERLAAALPAGALNPTGKLGHRRMLEDPEVVRRVTERILETE